MQDEDWRLGRRPVDLVQRGHAPLGKLELRPAPDNSHPLRRRGALRLIAQHAQSVGEGRNPIPTQLEVVVQATPDDVNMRVVQPGDNRAAASLDDGRPCVARRHDLVVRADGEEAAGLHRDRGR